MKYIFLVILSCLGLNVRDEVKIKAVVMHKQYKGTNKFIKMESIRQLTKNYPAVNHDHMKDALDDIAKHFEGKKAVFDPKYYRKLVNCMHKFNDSLLY